MSGHDGKCNKRYVDHPRDSSKPTFLIHGYVIHSPEKCRVLNDLGTRYAAGRTFKQSRNEPTIKKNVRQQEVNDVLQHGLEIILQGNKY